MESEESSEQNHLKSLSIKGSKIFLTKEPEMKLVEKSPRTLEKELQIPVHKLLSPKVL